jgi:drug/metabolite transporter (DMT)-like permease
VGATLVIAVPAALGAAAGFGLTGAVQHRAARATNQRGAVRLGLLGDLVRQPLWLASLVVNGVALLLQWVALSNGPLTLVQPLLVTGLLFAVALTSVLRRRRPDRVVLFGAVLCVVGLAAFLLLAQPRPGNDRLTLGEVIPLAAGLAFVLAGCIVAAVRYSGRIRVLALAGAAGVLYGVTAGMAKLAADDLRHGVAAVFTDWPVYLLAVCGPLGFLFNQYAFREGVALTPALAMIVLLDPLVSIGIGALWLGETLSAGTGRVIGEVLALGVVTAGVAVLSRRAPQVVLQTEKEERAWSEADISAA